MTLAVLLSALLLQPVLAEPSTLRVASAGAGAQWRLDGEPVAVTADGEAASFAVSAGRHDLWAVSAEEGSWSAFARLEPETDEGAAFVPAWTAEHVPAGRGRLPDWTGAAVLAVVAVGLAAWPSRSRRESD